MTTPDPDTFDETAPDVGLSPRRSLFDAVRPTVLAHQLGPTTPVGAKVLAVLAQRGVLAMTGERPDQVVVGSAHMGPVQPGWMLVDGTTAVGVAYGMSVLSTSDAAVLLEKQEQGEAAGLRAPNSKIQALAHRRTWCVLPARDGQSGRTLDALISVAQRPATGLIVIVVGAAEQFKRTLTGLGYTVFAARDELWSIVSGMDLAGRRSYLGPVAVVVANERGETAG